MTVPSASSIRSFRKRKYSVSIAYVESITRQSGLLTCPAFAQRVACASTKMLGGMERVVVVGAGTMGAGIAFVAAHARYAVDLIEPDASTKTKALERIKENAERAAHAAAASRVD